MARASPRKRELSKNTVSPMLPDSTMETANRREGPEPDASERVGPPAGDDPGEEHGTAHQRAEGIDAGGVSVPDSRRTRRLTTAQVRADASERSAPRVGSGRAIIGRVLP